MRYIFSESLCIRFCRNRESAAVPRCAGVEILSRWYRTLDQHVDSFNATLKTWGKFSLSLFSSSSFVLLATLPDRVPIACSSYHYNGSALGIFETLHLRPSTSFSAPEAPWRSSTMLQKYITVYEFLIFYYKEFIQMREVKYFILF